MFKNQYWVNPWDWWGVANPIESTGTVIQRENMWQFAMRQKKRFGALSHRGSAIPDWSVLFLSFLNNSDSGPLLWSRIDVLDSLQNDSHRSSPCIHTLINPLHYLVLYSREGDNKRDLKRTWILELYLEPMQLSPYKKARVTCQRHVTQSLITQ